MFTIVVIYGAPRFRDLTVKAEIVFDKGGRNPFVCNTRQEAEDYLRYLQFNFASYEEVPKYKIMSMREILS